MEKYKNDLMKKKGFCKLLKPLVIVLFIAFSYTYAPGQILNLTVSMDAAQEVPPLATAGIGTGSLTFNPVSNVLSGTVVFSGLSTPSTAGHIHTGALGVNGPVVIPIDASGGVGVQAGTMIVPPTNLATAGLLAAFLGNGLYINIHTGTNPGGEIRGQINMPTTTFSDVPLTGFASAQIEAIAGAGITGGCLTTPLSFYCPDNSITRGQMAVFLETSLGNPPNVCVGQFTDVPIGNPFCGFVERMAADGITTGCGGGNFCPNDPVTRGQMAVFIEVALSGVPAACAGTFGDVTAANPFCGFIELLAADGITGGCGGLNFCPNDPVTRAQMAVFIVSAPAPLLPD